MAVKPHVCASTDGQKGFVDVCHLESYLLSDNAPHCHHLALAFPKIGYVRPIGNFILDICPGKSVLYDADAFAHRPRHDCDASARVDSHLDLDPFLGFMECADAVPLDFIQLRDMPCLSGME